MVISLTTPALLFPAISLLLLAYTNRFLAIANLIRGLRKQYESHPEMNLLEQIQLLRKRIILIRNMQAFGIASIFSCVLTMFAVFVGYPFLANLLFGLSLLIMSASLIISFRETMISVNALKIELSRTEQLK